MMSSLKPNNPKVQVADQFGGVKNLALDTNRTDRQNESLFIFANLIAFDSSGLYSSMLIWILTPAVVIRVLNLLVIQSVLPAVAAQVLIAFLLAPVLLSIAFTANQLKDTHQSAAFFRLVLILAGCVLAIV